MFQNQDACQVVGEEGGVTPSPSLMAGDCQEASDAGDTGSQLLLLTPGP